MRRILAFFLVSLLIVPFTAYPKWYKGNTHTHTINSDGDSSPDEVARWYKEHRYHFVVITDHNFLTPVDGLNMILAAEEKFLVLSGEEVTDEFESPEDQFFALHLNAINLSKTLPPTGGSSVHEVLQTNLDSINAAGALAQLNHPNFHWSINVEEMYNLRNCLLFEVWNTSTDCNNTGGGGYPAQRLSGIRFLPGASRFMQWQAMTPTSSSSGVHSTLTPEAGSSGCGPTTSRLRP